MTPKTNRMSVSYHLLPVEKETESFVDLHSFDFKVQNNFSLFAELMINFRKPCLDYFDKQELFFDFVFSLLDSEVSETTYQPEQLKTMFLELLEILKTKENFPIKNFNYFQYEDLLECTYLFVNLNGQELNKILKDKVYRNNSNYDVNTSFGKWNNYVLYGDKLRQNPTTIYIKMDTGERFRSNLDLNAFPCTLNVHRTQSNISLERTIKQVNLITKTPYEHLLPMFNHLIELCDACEKRSLKMKSFISC